jgi:hypothetical protein
MTEWIEIPKRGSKSDIPADKVAAGYAKVPHGHFALRIALGHAVARTLGWTAETRLRVLWSPDATKLKIDVGPPRPRQQLRPPRQQEGLALHAHDFGLPGECRAFSRSARGRLARGDRRAQPAARELPHRQAAAACSRRAGGEKARVT